LSASAGVDVGSLWLNLRFHPFTKPILAPNMEAGIETILAGCENGASAKSGDRGKWAAISASWPRR
jgi:hypothetical protein